MGKTIIEKIIASHTDEPVEAGKVLWVNIDVATARDFGGPNVVKNYEREFGDTPVFDRERIFFTFDLVAPAKTIKYANNQMICRRFAKKQGIKVYDVDSGIGSHILMEEGIVKPGMTAVGTDSHYNILSAMTVFGQGMGDVDITFIFRTGKTYFEVPHTVRINLKGEYKFPITPKDIVLYILKHTGTKFALGKAIEFYGDVMEKMDVSGRITIASMVTEMGGIAGFFPNPDIKPDMDAKYTDELTIDISDIQPQIAVPPYPHNVHNISEVEGKKIDSVFIGSCTNGTYEDIKLAADILKGKKVHPDVMLRIVPATKKVYGKLLFSGILQSLFDAGAIIANPSCGGCAEGHIGMTGEGEVQLSTANRNYPGKQGKGDTFLVSPAVAAASAIAGKITAPEEG